MKITSQGINNQISTEITSMLMHKLEMHETMIMKPCSDVWFALHLVYLRPSEKGRNVLQVIFGKLKKNSLVLSQKAAFYKMVLVKRGWENSICWVKMGVALIFSLST